MCKKLNKKFEKKCKLCGLIFGGHFALHSDIQTYTETYNDINTYKKYGPYKAGQSVTSRAYRSKNIVKFNLFLEESASAIFFFRQIGFF